MQDTRLRLFQRAWLVVFVLCSFVYSLVLFKLFTPVINYYSDDIVLPKVIAKLPGGFDLKSTRVEWVNLRPFLVLNQLQAINPKLIPYVNKISGMNMSVDLFKSLKTNKWVINDINIEEINLKFIKNDLAIFNANKVVSDILVETKSNYDLQQKKMVIPRNLCISKVIINVDSHRMLAENAYYKDSGFEKKWNFKFTHFDNKPLNISSKFTLQEEDGVLYSSKGNIKIDANLPKYILQFVPNPTVINKFSGKLDIDFTYNLSLGLTLHVNHDVSSSFNYKKLAEIELERFRGNSSFYINSADKFNFNGKINEMLVNKVRSLDFNYNVKNKGMNGSEVMLTYFNVENISAISPYLLDKNNKIMRLLMRNVFQGEVRDLVLQWSGDSFEEIKNIYFDLVDFRTNSYSFIPGISGVNASVSYADNKGEIKLFSNSLDSSEKVSFYDRRISDRKIIFKVSPMEMIFSKVNDSWLFGMEKIRLNTGGINVVGRAELKFQPQHYPEVDIDLSADSVDLSSVKNFLPINVLPNGLNKYLKESLGVGRLKYSRVKIKNDTNLSRFGLLYSYSSDLSDAKLKYAPDWPELDGVKGKLLLDNNSFNLNIDKAYTMGQKIDSGHAHISDFVNPVLEAHIQTNFDLAKGLAIVDNSPLKKTVGKYFSDAKLYGSSDLDLGFKLDMKKDKVDLNSLYGKINLHDDNIKFDKFKVYFSKANGLLEFDTKKMWGKKLSAFQNDSKLFISLESGPNDLSVNLNGPLALDTIMPKYVPESLAKIVRGKPYIDGKIRFYEDQDRVRASIIAESKGGEIAIDMPPPLALSSDEKTPVLFKADVIDDKLTEFNINYAKNIYLSWHASTNSNDEVLTLKSPSINYSDWEKFFDDSYSSFKLPVMKLSLDELNIYGFKIAKPKLLIKKDGDSAKIDINSNSVFGKIKFKPKKFLTLDLDKLEIDSAGNGVASIDKLKGMDYQATIKEMRYLNRIYDNVHFDLKEKYSGYAIDDISMSWEKNKVSLKGYWQQGSKPKTYLEGHVDSNDLGDIVSVFPDFDSIKGGLGELKFKLSWPNSIEHLSVKDMRGIVSFNLTDGKIYNLGEAAETGIGFGRLFNLLSLNSLFNKVSLDFSDLGHESYPFDELIGDFTLGRGKIKTDKIMIKGGLGTVYSHGSIDVKNNNYDLYLAILPIVTSSIPTIAALAGGPLAGIIAWTASQIIEEPVSEMALQSYRITGGLANPVITEIDRDNLPAEILIQ
ncbi:MAG: hypothetical protein HON78_03955 [Legionellales bacterium]|jgi:uncharacterized protein YhdP|nr:hypothetical protein [Legionellales bacterium]